MGIAVFLISSSGYVIERGHVPVDAKAGPLVFSGYLGGPVSGLIAALIGSVARVQLGGENVWIGVGYYFATGLLGALIRFLVPSPDWPKVPPKALAGLILGTIAVQGLLIPFAKWEIGAQTFGMPTIIVAAFAASSISILLMYLIINTAIKFADAERLIRKSAHVMKMAANVANIGIFEREAGSDRLKFDQGMARIAGLPAAGELTMAQGIELVLPEDRGKLMQATQALWAGGRQTVPVLFRIRRPNGEIRHVQAQWAPQLDKHNKVIRLFGVYVDLTELYDMRLLKQQAESRLDQLVKNLPGGLISLDFLHDSDLCVTYISPACHLIWGHDNAELQHDPALFAALFDADDLQALKQAIRDATIDLHPFSLQLQITARDGARKYLGVHASATWLDPGKVQVDCIVLDTTAAVETRRLLAAQTAVAQQAQKSESIGQLTGGIAHDFNNMLGVVMGCLEILRDDLTDPAQVKLIDSALTASEHGASLIRSLLAFARRSDLQPSIISLNTVVQVTKKWASRTIPSTIEIEAKLQDDLWMIRADQSSSESALLNLMVNARDAIAGNGRISIETANVTFTQDWMAADDTRMPPGRYVMMSVTDTGAGIPEETLQNIFDPFFTTKSVGKGTGLGLSMVQGFMRQSGGAVQVSSQPGKGTTFKLYFHATDADTGPAPDAVAPNALPVNNQRILVAEDQPDLLNVIVAILEAAGYVVTPASSGDHACQLFKADPHYDLLLTDIVMPGNLQGPKLAKVLREMKPDLPVVFMSGYANDAALEGFVPQGKDLRLAKPIQRQDLLAAIAKTLAAAQAAQDNG